MPKTPRYKIQPTNPKSSDLSGSADDLTGALDAAWALNRHTERPIEILDQDAEGVVVATVSVTWADEDGEIGG